MSGHKSIQIDTFFGYIDVSKINFIVGRCKEPADDEVELRNVSVSKDTYNLSIICY